MNRFFFLLLTFLIPASSWAEDMGTSQREIAKATLVSENKAIEPGKPFSIGVLLEPKEGWHTYWENPGDAGMATNFTWTLPEGFSASGIEWPAPQRHTEGPLVTFSYVGNVFLPVTITPPASFSSESYTLKVKAEWLICKDICIPESANLEITMPVTQKAAEPAAHAALFTTARQAYPEKITKSGSLHSEDHKLTLIVPLSELKVKEIHSALFFPRQENIFKYASEQKLATGKDTLRLTIEKVDDTAPSGDISGILSLTVENNQQKHFDVAFGSAGSAGSVATASPSAKSSEAGETVLALPVVLGLAILGGLILNLMPCVLPVLSLKALAIMKKSGHEHSIVARQGIAYTLGIMVSFAVVAGLLLSLRQAGSVIGWGYQMQSPAFVGFLIYLLFLVGLSLSGLFHLPVLLGNASVADDSSVKGSFFTGVLATAVATPCTAPFMASAVGVALTVSPVESLLIFEALGFGLALPFLLISLFPQLRGFLPKPGAWMETFKQVLAFPMYASVIWLLWVLTLQTGAAGMAIAACGMLAIVIAIWMKPLFGQKHHAYRMVALMIYACIISFSLPMLSRMEISGMEHEMKAVGLETVDFSKETLAELHAAGKSVFVDATAAWCITCQLNGRTIIHSDAVMKAFKDSGVILMVADWTRHNDNITEFLDSFGYKGVPLYVFYPAGDAKPTVLPQLLTADIVIDTIKQKP